MPRLRDPNHYSDTLLALALAALVTVAEAADQNPRVAAGQDGPVMSAGRFEQVAEGELRLTGDVEVRYGELRLLADTVHYNDQTHIARAEGNVVVMLGNSQISADRVEINVETSLATFWDAHGYMDPDVIFHAAKLERISDDTVVISDGTVTTCTQPTPYWAFHVSRATLQKGHYATMRHVALEVKSVPLLYMPYLLWPLKEDRASGLLMPNVGYSAQRGSFIGNAFYLVMGRSQDLTLYLDLYGQTGTGVGYEYRFVPAPRAHGSFTGYYVNDTQTDEKRYRFKLNQAHQFSTGYRLLADLNKVSDLDYYLDFERDITQTTSPTVYSHIDFVRNAGHFAFNTRADRQEQFISTTSDLTLLRLPEMELRGRGIRLGRSPFYLSFVTSAGLYNKDFRFLDPNGSQDPDDPNSVAARREVTYARTDLFPTVSASFTPTPWLDISPSVSARETFYTHSLADPNSTESFSTDEDVSREFVAFNLSVVGPRFYRIFQRGSGEIKHTFEPRLGYSYVPEVSGGEGIIPFDEVDTLPGDVHKVAYSITSRIFSKKSATPADAAIEPEAFASAVTGPTQVQGPLTDLKDLPEPMKQALRDETKAPGVGAVEVATFDVTQEYSFDDAKPLSVAQPVEPDGTAGDPLTSQAGPIVASVRYNPTAAASVDASAAFSTLFDDLQSASFSANLRSLRHGYIRLSWFLNRDLAGLAVAPDPSDPNLPPERQFFDSSQVRLIGGTTFLSRKITLDMEGSYDLENRELRDRRYRLGYNTQCCGMLFEIAQRDFDTIDETEYRFVMNLRGVGTFLDLQGRP